MAPGICPHCGGPNTPGSISCQWCEAQLPPEIPQWWPAPSAEPARPLIRPMQQTPLAPVAGLAAVLIAAVVVVATVISAVAPKVPVGLIETIHVTTVSVRSPDDACGLDGADQDGFNETGNGSFALMWFLPYGTGPNGSGPRLPCTVTNVSTDTPGFSVSAPLPATVARLWATLWVTTYAPSQYNGPLNLTFQ